MIITYYGHSCFLLDDGSCKVLTDPFLSGSGCSPISAEQIEANYIFVSHGHGDHFGDTVEIAKRTGAVVGGVIDLCNYLVEPHGIPYLAGSIGGTLWTAFGSVKIVAAVHGSGIPGGPACGFVFQMGEKKIYFAGDTALTVDMTLLKQEAVDVALLPIGDTFTMGPADARRAVQMIEPKITVPMHYNTFPMIAQDPDRFAADLSEDGYVCRVLHPGESLPL